MTTRGRTNVLSMVLAGGEGKRLMPLTRDRAKPAVPFGGHYRLIDFALSNLVNGGQRRIVVLTQYKSHSLNVHISRTWRMSTLLGNYVTSVPAQMRLGQRWFLGSADAIYQNLNLVEDADPEYLFVFGADHIYRMDPMQMLEHHIESGAGVTVAGIRVPLDQAYQFGVIEKGRSTRIEAFREKPPDARPIPEDPASVLVSMGNYVFTTKVLLDQLALDAEDETSRHDLGGNLIPRMVEAGEASVYDFINNEVPGVSDRERGYWRDVGTLDSYHEAHMDLTATEPIFNLYNDDWPIYTAGHTQPPAKVVAVANHGAGQVSDSILSNGVILSGAYVYNSVLSPGVRVETGATVENSILLNDVRVGAGATVRGAIIDKNVDVPPGYQIGGSQEQDEELFTVSSGGITAVAKGHQIL
ncbi:MAG TPA: glucose-1-phosphate adenylyltransferase [Acidimicrobiia bacterium]|nr:glucose-1-phosphate adenylyltransferase [Acidimicrobiia bacterium]